MKLVLIGAVVGLVVGIGLTVFYFALAEFFRVEAAHKAAFEKRMKTLEPRPPRAKGKAVG